MFRAELMQLVEDEPYGAWGDWNTERTRFSRCKPPCGSERQTRSCTPKLNPALAVLRYKLKRQRFPYHEDIIEREGKLWHVFTGPHADRAPLQKAPKDYTDPLRNNPFYRRMIRESKGVKGSYRRECWAHFEACMRMGNYIRGNDGELHHTPLKGKIHI